MNETETKPIEEIESEHCCDSCGGSLEDGFEVRDYGTDRETGYHDYETLCSKCANNRCDDCGREAYEHVVGINAYWTKRLCDSCFSSEVATPAHAEEGEYAL